MISFIKSNLNIFIPILVLFITFDTFLLLYKFYLTLISNLKISYNAEKSYYNNENRLAVINLTIENKSANPTSILRIKLVDGSKSYLALIPDTQYFSDKSQITLRDDETKFIDTDILSKNILQNIKFPKHSLVNGYAIFKDIESTVNSKNYKIFIDTPSKTFRKRIKKSKIKAMPLQ